MLEMLEDANSHNGLGEAYVKCGKTKPNVLKYLYSKYNELTVIDLWNFIHSKTSDVV